jgi:hypothetical protein
MFRSVSFLTTESPDTTKVSLNTTESVTEFNGMTVRLSGFTEAVSDCATAKTGNKKNKNENKKASFM